MPAKESGSEVIVVGGSAIEVYTQGGTSPTTSMFERTGPRFGRPSPDGSFTMRGGSGPTRSGGSRSTSWGTGTPATPTARPRSRPRTVRFRSRSSRTSSSNGWRRRNTGRFRRRSTRRTCSGETPQTRWTTRLSSGKPPITRSWASWPRSARGNGRRVPAGPGRGQVLAASSVAPEISTTEPSARCWRRTPSRTSTRPGSPRSTRRISSCRRPFPTPRASEAGGRG